MDSIDFLDFIVEHGLYKREKVQLSAGECTRSFKFEYSPIKSSIEIKEFLKEFNCKNTNPEIVDFINKKFEGILSELK
jgi:hypothetical protein